MRRDAPSASASSRRWCTRAARPRSSSRRPYRNAALLQGLLQTLKGTTRLAVCCGMTLAQQKVGSALVADWKQRETALPLDLPAVFLIGR